VDGERLHAEKINRKGTQRTQRIFDLKELFKRIK
jgi:hypothetical protein